MKKFRWDRAKNDKLKESRGISFEEIVLLIEQGASINIMDHPNREKYLNQQVLEVLVGDYVFLIPFVEDRDAIFLTTIISSRKATKRYRSRRQL